MDASAVVGRFVTAVDAERLGAYGVHVLVGDDEAGHRRPGGWIVGGSGLELRTEELARVGRLLRDRGRWAGKSLVDESWVDRMHGTWHETGGEPPFDRYGLAVWAGPGEGRRLDGRYGQYVLVDDERNAVVTITAHEESRDHRLVEIAYEALRG